MTDLIQSKTHIVRSTTAILLENQEKELREEASFLSEQPNVNTQTGSNAAGFGAKATDAGPVAGFDPVLNQSNSSFNA